MNITFDRYHTYDEVKDFLSQCVKEYPHLTRLEVIGKSYLGRDIFCLEVTQKETGRGEDKPGVYADANTHAGEITGCEVILYTIRHLLENYGKDATVTKLVDTRVFYFIPRISVDGSDYYLSTPYMLRSSLNPWPKDTDDKPGLYPEDIDGDGKILTMRVKDPHGAWKISEKDPRIMVRRRPDDLDDPSQIYYSVYQEGLIRDYDPDLPIKPQRGKYNIDFNRNYPTNWAIPEKQRGSGDYPFSEPEMKAIGDFYLAHPNIVTSMAYHTSGGYVLRPLCTERDSRLDPRDLSIYRELGELAQEITGYQCVSVFEGFTYDQSKPEVGSDLEWAYETLGIIAFETELWDMRSKAGVPKRPMHALRTMTSKDREEDELKLLKWNDEVMGNTLFHPWRPFNHPQLGAIEIGGWEPKFGRQNPPPWLLEEECKKNALFNLTRAAITPSLVIEKTKVVCLDNELYKVEAVILNEGYLPTHGTFQALKMTQAKPVKVSLNGKIQSFGGEAGQVEASYENPFGDFSVVAGKAEVEIGHLGGKVGGGDIRKKLSWVIRGKKGTQISIVAFSPRAGKKTATVILE